ncbi:hypothetical protein BR93DRAFT_888004, partial [Coniochaeta sp. PMI_546]
KDYIKKTGKLNYLAIGTRADLSFIMSKLYEANVILSKQYYYLLAYVFRYFKKTIDFYGVYGGKDYSLKDLKLITYAYTAFVDCPLTRYLTGRHIMILVRSPVF